MANPVPEKIGFTHLSRWLGEGWRTFLRLKALSAAYAGVFAVLGLAQFVGVVSAGLAPLMVPLAGGFMFIGPALLCGFFHASNRLAIGQPVSVGDFFAGFRHAPPALWVVALVETFVFLIWLTDAGIVYGLYFGLTPDMGLAEFVAGLAGEGDTLPFLFFSSLMWLLLAFIIYATSAFAVPLLFYRRANLAGAVSASVKAVFSSLLPMLAWGMLLSFVMLAAILLFLPLFPVVFPVLAYASGQAYREIFPQSPAEIAS